MQAIEHPVIFSVLSLSVHLLTIHGIQGNILFPLQQAHHQHTSYSVHAKGCTFEVVRKSIWHVMNFCYCPCNQIALKGEISSPKCCAIMLSCGHSINHFVGPVALVVAMWIKLKVMCMLAPSGWKHFKNGWVSFKEINTSPLHSFLKYSDPLLTISTMQIQQMGELSPQHRCDHVVH